MLLGRARKFQLLTSSRLLDTCRTHFQDGRHAFFDDADVLTMQDDGRVFIQSGMLVQGKINGERKMTVVTVTSRGRITLPKAMRTAMGLLPGARLTFTQLQDGTVIMTVRHRKTEELGGTMGTPSQP